MVSVGIVLGLSSAVAFGLLDSLISLASRYIGTLQSIVLAQAVSAVLILIYLVSFLRTGLAYQPSSVPLLLLVGISLGIVNTCANLSLYRGLAIGPVALVSPIAASYGLVTTILALCIYHDALDTPQILAIGLVFSGVVLAATDNKQFALSRLSGTTWLRLCILALALAVSTLTCIVLLLVFPRLATIGWIVLVPGSIEAACIYCALIYKLPARSTPTLKRSASSPANCQGSGATGRSYPGSFFGKRRGPVGAGVVADVGSGCLHRPGVGRGVLFALGAMLCFGIEFFVLSAATRQLGPTQPIMWSRTCSVILLLCYAFRKRTAIWRGLSLKHLGIIALIGLLDTLGMVWYDIGTSQDATSIVATLSSTYMLVPTLFGIIIYRERLKRLQWVGISSIILGVILLSLAG